MTFLLSKIDSNEYQSLTFLESFVMITSKATRHDWSGTGAFLVLKSLSFRHDTTL
jgi:hypothetical protein